MIRAGPRPGQRPIRMLLVALAAMLVVPAAADATFPGQNGKIVYSKNSTVLWTIAPDGSGPAEYPVSGAVIEPAWSADGQRLAFTRREPDQPQYNEEIWTADADGDGLVNLTNHPDNDWDPAWSPDGTRLVFNSARGGAGRLWVMNADGSDQHLLGDGTTATWSPDGRRIAIRDTSGTISTIRPDGTGKIAVTTSNFTDSNPSWSPDGRRIGFARFVFDPACPRFCDLRDSSEVWVVNADGSGATRLTSPGPGIYDNYPLWAPDGSRIVFHRHAAPGGSSPPPTGLYTMTPDGTGVSLFYNDPDGVATPDWQPLPVNTPSMHVRPKAASPLQVSLVPAFVSCTSPNRVHGPPLGFGSCTPPQPRSSQLTVGGGAGESPARSVGYLRLAVVPGIAGPPADTDVKLRFSTSNVMNRADLTEYTGKLRVSVLARRTDKDGSVASTSVDFPFEFDVPCVATADPGLAADCTTATTANAVLPGSAAEGTRAVWGVERMVVLDGGTDGDPDTAANTNTPFLTQGVFVP